MLERVRRNPSSLLSLFMMLLCGTALVFSLDFPTTARRFPVATASLGLVLSLYQLVADLVRGPTAADVNTGDLRPDDDLSLGEALVGVRVELAWLVGLLAGTWLFGAVIALPAYIVAYVALSSTYSWRRGLALSAGFTVFFLGVFSVVLGTAWPEAVINAPQAAVLDVLNSLRG